MSNKQINQLLSHCNGIADSLNINFQHHAGIYRGSKLLYTGCNNSRNCFNGRCICYSTHAEMDVLQQLLKGEVRTTI